MSLVVVGAGISGLVASHVSGYKALVIEASERANTNFGDMVGARFIHDSPELRSLFGYRGPSETVEVTSDAEDRATGLERYVHKTRQCELTNMPPAERESAMNWGGGTFDYLPIDVNRWARYIERQAGVVYGSKLVSVQRKPTGLYLELANGSSVRADKVLFTIPLPTMLKVVGHADARFRTFPTTVGRFKAQGISPDGYPPTMHYITDPSTPVTRVTTKRNLIIVEASASQGPELLMEMGKIAQRRADELGKPEWLDALGFSTFGHHFEYFPGFTEARSAAVLSLERTGLWPLGRYAQWSHRTKTLETYIRANRLINDAVPRAHKRTSRQVEASYGLGEAEDS